MLATAQPRSYNVLFQDAATQEEIRKHLEPAQREWAQLVSASETAQPTAGSGVVLFSSLVTQQRQQRLDELFQQFTKSSTATESYAAIDRLMYWEPGSYELELFVNTTRPDVSISSVWGFTLTPDEVRTLRLNPVVILREVCDQSVIYNFVYPAYDYPAYEEGKTASQLETRAPLR